MSTGARIHPSAIARRRSPSARTPSCSTAGVGWSGGAWPCSVAELSISLRAARDTNVVSTSRRIRRARRVVHTEPLRILAGGGDRGIRTPGLRIANAALSQLSYIPMCAWGRRTSRVYQNRLFGGRCSLRQRPPDRAVSLDGQRHCAGRPRPFSQQSFTDPRGVCRARWDDARVFQCRNSSFLSRSTWRSVGLPSSAPSPLPCWSTSRRLGC